MEHAPLSGRTVLVIGADAAVSCALTRAGACVVLAARDGPSLAALAEELGSAGGQAVAVRADVTDPVSVRRLVEQTLGAFGRLDAAVNVAEASAAMTYEIAAMRRAGGGRIVNVAGPGCAVIELTRAAALEAAGSGVRINAVAAAPRAGAQQVADAVVWLCSDGAWLVTGETLHVEATLWRPFMAPRPAP
ncbi:SDR family NAD(P)-dependent oxidoreductase [Nonomuraea sp. SYSU D8015]|uniref:SDR family NAD(P)-dependent oxidoreductase n=1 Tax=Nonomuraea sp. SYSU D8015 TaxID=2593644 RepID=UPI001660D8D9|nr:SDR family oxidoreductase [Nonomuraea sp. SYSU D8015]